MVERQQLKVSAEASSGDQIFTKRKQIVKPQKDRVAKN
jgi:hypothetical protein